MSVTAFLPVSASDDSVADPWAIAWWDTAGPALFLLLLPCIKVDEGIPASSEKERVSQGQCRMNISGCQGRCTSLTDKSTAGFRDPKPNPAEDRAKTNELGESPHAPQDAE